jgi:hypothetical protein
MKDLSYFQQKVLHQLYPSLENPPKDLKNELVRVYKFYLVIFENYTDEELFGYFSKYIEKLFIRIANQDYGFFMYKYFSKEYNLYLSDFISDFPSSSELDFITKQLDFQSELYKRKLKYLIPYSNNKEFNVMKFLSNEFFEEREYDTKKKITFLQNRLEVINGLRKPDNPFDKVFIDGETYQYFLKYVKSHIVEPYIDWSYLKKRLETEKLIHRITDIDFINFIFYDLGVIKSKTHEKFIIEGRFKTLKNCRSTQRDNNFYVVFSAVLN